jgi:nucleoside phosphorylase
VSSGLNSTLTKLDGTLDRLTSASNDLSGAIRRILVVAATAREIAPADGWLTLACGVGPVDAAATTAVAIARERPLAVVHVGIAGARRASGLMATTMVVGIESIYCDLDVPEAWAPRRLAPPVNLVDAACRAVPSASRQAIGTSGRVGRTSGCAVESMEGFAVLRAAALAGVPAIEVRAISNEIEELDRGRWRFDEAFAAVLASTPAIVREVAACLS